MKLSIRSCLVVMALLGVANAWGMRPQYDEMQGFEGPRPTLEPSWPTECQVIVLNSYEEPVTMIQARVGRANSLIESETIPGKTVRPITVKFGAAARALRWFKNSSNLATLPLGAAVLAPGIKEMKLLPWYRYLIVEIFSTEETKERAHFEIPEYHVHLARKDKPAGWDDLFKLAGKIAQEDQSRRGMMGSMSLSGLETRKDFDRQLAQVFKDDRRYYDALGDVRQKNLNRSREWEQLSTASRVTFFFDPKDVIVPEPEFGEMGVRESEQPGVFQTGFMKDVGLERSEGPGNGSKLPVVLAKQEMVEPAEVVAVEPLQRPIGRPTERVVLSKRQVAESEAEPMAEEGSMESSVESVSESGSQASRGLAEGDLMPPSEDDLLAPPSLDDLGAEDPEKKARQERRAMAKSEPSGSQQRANIEAGMRSLQKVKESIKTLKDMLQGLVKGEISQEDMDAEWSKHQPLRGPLYIKNMKENAGIYLRGIRDIVGSDDFKRFKSSGEIAMIMAALPQQQQRAEAVVAPRPMVIPVKLPEEFRITPAKLADPEKLEMVKRALFEKLKPARESKEFNSEFEKLFKGLCDAVRLVGVDDKIKAEEDLGNIASTVARDFSTKEIGEEQGRFASDLVSAHQKLLEIFFHERAEARKVKMLERRQRVASGQRMLGSAEISQSAPQEHQKEVLLIGEALASLVQLQNALVALYAEGRASASNLRNVWLPHASPALAAFQLPDMPVEGELYKKYSSIRAYRTRLENIIDAEAALNELEILLQKRDTGGDVMQMALASEWNKHKQAGVNKGERDGDFYRKLNGLDIYQKRRAMIMNSLLFKKYLGSGK